jgi:5-methylcytosine-specific restriction endonuclease McrA
LVSTAAESGAAHTRGRRSGAERSPERVECVVARPRSRRRQRYIPAAVRREVWVRDGGQCAYVGAAGRCAERGFLEYHHVVPYADGGLATVENVQLRCRSHNGYEAGRRG